MLIWQIEAHEVNFALRAKANGVQDRALQDHRKTKNVNNSFLLLRLLLSEFFYFSFLSFSQQIVKVNVENLISKFSILKKQKHSLSREKLFLEFPKKSLNYVFWNRFNIRIFVIFFYGQ